MELGTGNLNTSCGDSLKYFRDDGVALFALRINVRIDQYCFQAFDILEIGVMLRHLSSDFVAFGTTSTGGSHAQ